ncbi:MAG: hypothetical protein AAF242_11740 [Bacteroidota bacterium]
MRKQLRWQLISIFIIGMLLLNFPIVNLFAAPKLVFGIPTLYLYLMIAWLLIIFMTRHMIDRAPKQNK